LTGVLFLGPRSWLLAFLATGVLSSFLGVALLGALGHWIFGSLGNRRPRMWLVCELWLGVLRVFRERVYAGD
jgi:thiol:disulfide interchange protein